MAAPLQFSWTVKSTPEIQGLFTRLGAKAIEAGKAALYRVGHEVMTLAQDRTPVDTGALKGSGQVQFPEVRGAAVTLTMGFGDASVGYAIPVHENLTAFHPVGRAKFLESAAHDTDLGARLAAHLKLEVALRAP